MLGKRTRSIHSIVLVASTVIGRGAQAVEPWADPRLPVTKGLELWLDASRLNRALAARSAPELRNDERVRVWPDGSGKGRDLVQPAPERRPQYQGDLLQGEALAALRFDGLDDHLGASGLGVELAAATVFIVAAPHSNPGSFRAFLSLSAAGKNDYLTGLNIDQGGGGSGALEVVNVEGAGMPGQRNLFDGSLDFGGFHVIAVAAAPGEKGVGLHVDGQPAGSRPRAPGNLRMDEVRVGARHYSNTPEPPGTRDFLPGDLAEVIVYGRILTEAERAGVESHLQKKYEKFLQRPGLPRPPPVEVLVPGFEARELPVRLTNQNDLLYAPDGSLITLGYDGRVHRLRDTDGDGLEDRVEPFWYEPTIRIPIAMALRQEGLYVTSHRKVSLLRDLDGDGKADREEVVAEGWVEPDVATGGGVDAMGLAFDGEGNLYFGLGCSDFTNAYRVKDGRARYELSSERGTILKVSPDRKRREILCTGIRFPCTLAFNRHGDLFATDQEGETWLPDGNPLDELDHILPGRHYGFPPRHPTHLPGVADEPPVVGFGPQHQSTCGLTFNEGGPGKRVFGPDSWEGDAFVGGFSRGKLWRVRLTKTPSGYVGHSTLIAACSLMALDTAVSPDGALVLASHGGAPDWGTGPNGRGRLFKIFHRDRDAPQPVAAWAQGPLEVRVAFDRPLDAGAAGGLQGGAITFGEHVRAGDRFEVHRPGYASVKAQMDSPRGRLRIVSARVSEGSTLVLTTDPHPLRASYSLTLPGIRSPGAAGIPAGDGATVELAYDLTGVEATFEPAGGGERSQFWLPHLDLDVSRTLTAGSVEHRRLEELLRKPGKLILRTRISPSLLHPTTEIKLEMRAGGRYQAEPEDWQAPRREPMAIAVSIETGAGGRPPHLHVSYRAAGDPMERPLPLEWLLLPWAPERRPEAPAPAGPAPELAGGDWKRGEAVFTSPEAKCSACHAVRGKGGKFGPDLSNLVHRDAGSVLRDITEPSAAINPDYVPYTAFLKDGRLLTGVIRAEGDRELRLLDAEANETVLPRDAVRELLPASVSIMPQGILKTIGEARLRDLMTFLITAAPDGAGGEGSAPDRTLNIVLVAGPKDHGPGEHDYPEWQRRWRALLGNMPGVRVSTAQGWPDRGHWDFADLVVLYFWNHEWSDRQYRDLDAYLARGGGLVAIHSAVIPEREPEKLAARIGLAWSPGRTKYRHGPLDLKIVAPGDHPITRDLEKVHFIDETYWPLLGETALVDVLATAEEEGQPRPILWTFRPGRGRVFVSILGHYLKTFDDPTFRSLLLRGMSWAADSPLGN